MAIKYTIQGLLNYAALAVYAVAFVMMVLRFAKLGQALYLIGFAFMIIAFGYRCYQKTTAEWSRFRNRISARQIRSGYESGILRYQFNHSFSLVGVS